MSPIAIGRRNWMHPGSNEARSKIAAILSIVETCRQRGQLIRKYLVDVHGLRAATGMRCQWPGEMRLPNLRFRYRR